MTFSEASVEFARLWTVAPSRSTFSRWIRFGILSPAGARVKLAARRAGGRWLLEPDAVAAFVAAVSV